MQSSSSRINTRKKIEKKSSDTGDDNLKICEHQFQTFKQTIIPTNDSFHGTAYFIVMACLKCNVKRYIDYIVENAYGN